MYSHGLKFLKLLVCRLSGMMMTFENFVMVNETKRKNFTYTSVLKDEYKTNMIVILI